MKTACQYCGGANESAGRSRFHVIRARIVFGACVAYVAFLCVMGALDACGWL